jgi:hypothetical protein
MKLHAAYSIVGLLAYFKKSPLPPVYWRWVEEGGGMHSLTMARAHPYRMRSSDAIVGLAWRN